MGRQLMVKTELLSTPEGDRAVSVTRSKQIQSTSCNAPAILVITKPTASIPSSSANAA